MSDDMLPKDAPPLQSIHTLQTDLAEVAAKEQVTKVEIIAKQEEKKVELPSLPSTASSSHSLRTLLLTLAAILVLSGAGYGIFVLARQRSELPPVVPIVTVEQDALITFNSEKEINFSNEDASNREALRTRLLSDANAGGSGVTRFNLSMPFSGLLQTLSPSIPSEYHRSLGEESFFGSFGGATGGNFFIVTSDSYEQAFAGQLEWEKTMGNDILPLFGISSSTPARFEDRVISNRDVRVAVDAKGDTLFLYGFQGQNTSVFARNEEVFRAIYEMLLRGNL